MTCDIPETVPGRLAADFSEIHVHFSTPISIYREEAPIVRRAAASTGTGCDDRSAGRKAGSAGMEFSDDYSEVSGLRGRIAVSRIRGG
jgi:hypothetical protein